MSILPMQKIRLTVSRDSAARVLGGIQHLGIVEFHEHDLEAFYAEEQTSFDHSYHASRLDFAVSFLSPFERQGMISKILEGSAVHASEQDILDTAATFDASPIIEEAQQLEERLNATEARLNDIREEELVLTSWTGLTIDLSQNLVTKTTTTALLTILEDAIHPFERALAEADLDIHLEPAGEDAYRLTYLNDDAEAVEEILSHLSIETVTLPRYTGTPQEALAQIADERASLEQEQHECRERARELTEHLPNIRKLADYYHWRDKQVETLHTMGKASLSVYVFEGWCPKREIDTLYHAIDTQTHPFDLETIPPSDTETPPVLIENNRRVRPYEQVTRLYGVPTHRDLDPTLYFSGFFFISFGLCLTDVGYGIFLAVLTGLIMLLFRVQSGLKQLLTLLFYGGIASTIVGLFFGGYFGIDMAFMPQALQNLQYFDPIGSPLPFFYLTLAIGFVQIYLGLILDIVRAAKQGEFRDGFLNTGPWLLLLGGIALYLGGMFGALPASALYLWLIIAGAVALVLTQGRKESNIFAKAFKGVLSLYGAIDYFSNVLSYSRLLALGLATSALAFSVNLIAGMVNDMVPILGPLLMVIVLIVGHSFNLIINVLGAYIHTARLQFVEFFGKFIQGTGREFRPFARDERHTVLEGVEKATAASTSPQASPPVGG
ncbi:MAG: V-type ATP synthase subunit I [Candidatus Paceibacterota bacterium]